MDIFAGNFAVEKKIAFPDLDYDILQTGETSYFIMGADDSIKTSKDVLAFLNKEFGTVIMHDICIETEDVLEVISSEYEAGSYECVSFEGPVVTFGDILERFADSMEAVCVRECEESKMYGNKIVRVDFIY